MGLYNKSWLVWINRNSLDSIIWEGWECKHSDSFGVEHIPKEIKKFIENKNITTNIYRLQAYDSIMCGYFFYWTYWFYAKRQKFIRV